MSDNALKTEERGGTKLVLISGEVDLSWSQQVRKAILDALQGGQPVAIDLSAVGYIDSSGIAALVEGFQQARGKQQKFALVAVSPAVMAVLELARLDRVFPLATTFEDAFS
jgi:anti-sigma B factor antagonist